MLIINTFSLNCSKIRKTELEVPVIHCFLQRRSKVSAGGGQLLHLLNEKGLSRKEETLSCSITNLKKRGESQF